MEFDVRSGIYRSKIIADNFQAAGRSFIASILRTTPNAEFGAIVQVGSQYFATQHLMPGELRITE